MSGAGPLVALEQVSKRYEAVGEAEGPLVLRGVDLELRRGEALAVVGPSGSGKSTLLHLIGGLCAPSSGRLLLGGRDLGALGADQLALVRNREIGFVFQAHHLLPQCTVLENVLVPTLAGHDRAERAAAVERARQLLDQVGLAGRGGRRPAQLSGGECQRVAVARALINQPALLLADEPTGSLDATSADELADLLVRLNRERELTLIVVTHSERIAARLTRRVTMRDGRLAAGG